MDSEEKLIDFLEKHADLYRELGFVVHQVDFERFKEDIMEPPLTLFEMIEDRINSDKDIAAIIYLANKSLFVRKESRNLLAEYFNETFKKIKKHARHLKREIFKRYGEDWLAKVYFPSAYP